MANLKLQDLTEELRDDKDQAITLASFVGKRVLLFIFPRAGTSGCTEQACGFRDAFPKIDAAGATVLGMSTDKPKALAKWKAAENLPYTLISDPDHKVIERLGAWGERSMYGRKFIGTIRSHFVFNAAGEMESEQIKISPKDSIKKGVEALVK
jgi:peroxiredoxin Q/BCP